MVWQPEFQPHQLDRPYGPQPIVHAEHIKFTIGVISDKGLPEITFIVNPSRLTFNLAHMSQAQAIRSGWSIEHAGQALDQMIVEGKSAMCIIAPPVGLCTANSGEYLQQCSLARNIIDQLVLIYKDNASVRNQNFCYVIDLVGLVYIFYDHVLYTGRFDELTISESGSSPFQVDFNFTFTVHRKEMTG